jgi:hypothetical protein
VLLVKIVNEDLLIQLKNQIYYDSIKTRVKILEEQYLQEQLSSRNSTVTNSVPIKAHIIRQTDETGGLTVTELKNAITVFNANFDTAGLNFFLCEGINYIDSDAYYNFQSNEEGALTGPNNINGVINIYFTDAASSGGNPVCEYAYFPGGPETIMMVNNCVTNGTTLSHEMGHFFALPHTHGNSNVDGSTEELVNGSNCETTGDFICDTPADPQLNTDNVNSGCQYVGSTQDANNDFYQPDPLNLMSYSRKNCR